MPLTQCWMCSALCFYMSPRCTRAAPAAHALRSARPTRPPGPLIHGPPPCPLTAGLAPPTSSAAWKARSTSALVRVSWECTLPLPPRTPWAVKTPIPNRRFPASTPLIADRMWPGILSPPPFPGQRAARPCRRRVWPSCFLAPLSTPAGCEITSPLRVRIPASTPRPRAGRSGTSSRACCLSLFRVTRSAQVAALGGARQ